MDGKVFTLLGQNDHPRTVVLMLLALISVDKTRQRKTNYNTIFKNLSGKLTILEQTRKIFKGHDEKKRKSEKQMLILECAIWRFYYLWIVLEF